MDVVELKLEFAGKYRFDFSQMTQANVHTTKVRQLKRESIRDHLSKTLEQERQMKCLAASLLGPPSLFAHLEVSREVPLSPEDFLYKSVEDHFFSTWRSSPSRRVPKVRIVSISYIYPSSTLYQTYCIERKKVASSIEHPEGCTPIPDVNAFRASTVVGSVNLNEHFLYHGTLPRTADRIIQQGWDPLQRRLSTASFFAEDSAKAASYPTGAPALLDDNNERCMLLARVLLGEAKLIADDYFHGRPERPEGMKFAGQPYDSLIELNEQQGGNINYREYVIFKESQAMPTCRIVYQSTEMTL